MREDCQNLVSVVNSFITNETYWVLKYLFRSNSRITGKKRKKLSLSSTKVTRLPMPMQR